jgi:hypothetical protein
MKIEMSIREALKTLNLHGSLPHPEEIEPYIQDIVAKGNRFITTFENNCPSEDSLHVHDAWIQSEAGQKTLLRLAEDVIAMIDGYPKNSVPGHDRRHIFKDLAASFHIIEEEKFGQDWRSLLLFPSLMHDSGRLIEEVFRDNEANTEDDGKTHGYFSFKMFQEILDDHADIPDDLKQEMLYAVVTHQSGRTYDRTMAWAVQRADREQLTGGELFNRILTSNVGMGGIPLATQFNAAALPQSFQGLTFLPCVTYYAHRLYENLGAQGEARANRLKAMALSCIQIASIGNGANLTASTPVENWADDPFIHWTETGWKRPGLQDMIVPQVRQHLKNASALLAYTPEKNIEDLMIESLEAPVSNLPDDVKSRLTKLMRDVNPEGQASYARALLMMQNFRETSDREDHLILRTVSEDPQTLPFVKSLSASCQKRMGQVTVPLMIKDLKIA